jgi:hypothetical protein
MADTTTTTGPEAAWFFIKDATFSMAAAVFTEAPPNLNTSIDKGYKITAAKIAIIFLT